MRICGGWEAWFFVVVDAVAVAVVDEGIFGKWCRLEGLLDGLMSRFHVTW